MIMQYLADEGYNASQMTIQDESNVKWHDREENMKETRRLKKAILGNTNPSRSSPTSFLLTIPSTALTLQSPFLLFSTA